MIPILSLVTSIKDYLEVVHKIIEYDSVNLNYTELGSIFTFFIISVKNCIGDFLNFSWLLKENVWSLPIIIPEISSAMISEISVLDGYFHNTFNFLDTPISYGMPTQNILIVCLEKLTIGIINSFFLFLPTSIAHIITLRRFVMQGLDAGYISGLGTIAGNMVWLASVILGFRFIVIPWLSLDIFRYILGFILLVKYMWDSYNERKMVLENVSKRKIFILNFLLALTEQTSLYPFISNLSLSPEASILETIPSFAFGEEGTVFIGIHIAYLLGIAFGSLSLLHFSCWFWENPAFKLYMWVISSFKVSTSFYYKMLNFTFLYLTMLSAVCSIPYYGLDYTITNPLGYVSDDRIIQDKVVLETSFLGSKASDRNTRRNRGRHGRRERWKRRIRKYRTFDASLYDQGIYDLFTVEDLNYGFDRFWLRRKLRNHRVRFRFFPGPWMRSFKKQLAKPRLESFTGPRIEFFRILFEQVYHPSFHAYQASSTQVPLKNSTNINPNININDVFTTYPPSPVGKAKLGEVALSYEGRGTGDNPELEQFKSSKGGASITSTSTVGLGSLKEEKTKEEKQEKRKNIQSNIYSKNFTSSLFFKSKNKDKTFLLQKATLRKFLRKFENRVKTSQIINLQKNSFNSFGFNSLTAIKTTTNGFDSFAEEQKLKRIVSKKQKERYSTLNSLDEEENLLSKKSKDISFEEKALKKQRMDISRKDLQILNYRFLLTNSSLNNKIDEKKNKRNDSLMLLHPLKFYLQQEAAFKRKLRYYSPNIFRKFSVENNAPYFRVMMKRYFYNYKPNLRWERTMKAASLRKARRKTTRIPKQFQKTDLSTISPLLLGSNASSSLSLPSISSTYSPVTKETLNSVIGQRITTPLEKAALQKSTYNYSVVSKRANRYRYQIYKDVLQHWYYSPFNRFLLKLDVDSFIRRQPKAHFLTAKEENLLHLRRLLLSEHYNTLRWYTNMEHYRSMKTQLNSGTKSFSSRTYNQQFSGTFKKVRHLFAITPSSSIASSSPFNSLSRSGFLTSLTSLKEKENETNDTYLFQKDSQQKTNVVKDTKYAKEDEKLPNVLKFDQPLYNEYPRNSLNPFLNPLIIHEELFTDFYATPNRTSSLFPNQEKENPTLEALLNLKSTPEYVGKNDLLSQSQNIVRQYLIQTRSIREEYIKKLLEEKNYSELTKFLYKGQKTRGNEPVTNQNLLNKQEKNYLLTSVEKASIEEEIYNLKQKTSFTEKQKQKIEEFYLTYLKNWKRRVNDQESLKNYLIRRIEKREKRKQKKEKQLLNKLNRLESWLSMADLSVNTDFTSSTGSTISTRETKQPQILTTGLQKSILDGLFILNNIDTKGVSLNEKKMWKVLLLSKIKEKSARTVRSLAFDNFVRLQDLSLHFNDLKYMQKLKLSNEIKTSVQTTRKLLKKQFKQNFKNKNKIGLYYSFKKKLAKVVLRIGQTVKTVPKNTFYDLFKLTNFLKPIKRKSLQDWRKKERVLSKEKRSRKDFKLLNKKSEPISTFNFIDRNELDFAYSVPSRKKRDINQNIDLSEPDFLLYSFKRKRSPQRRSRIRRNRGVFKKRTLSDSLRKDFSEFLNEKEANLKLKKLKTENNQTVWQKLKTVFEPKTPFALFSELNASLPSLPTSPSEGRDGRERRADEPLSPPIFERNEVALKQRKAKQRKERFWKQKRSKYSQKRRKYRKRRRYSVVKIRNLNKQFKRIKNQIIIQNWWWQSIQASNEALWQIEKDKLIQQKLSQLSTTEILERDSFYGSSFSANQKQSVNDSLYQRKEGFTLQEYNSLQIGQKDFKPLALPEAIRFKKASQQGTDLEINSKKLDFPLSEGKERHEAKLFPLASEALETSRSSFFKSSREQGDNEASLSEIKGMGQIGEALLKSVQQRGPTGAEGEERVPNNIDNEKIVNTVNLNSLNVLNKLYDSLFINKNSEIQENFFNFKEFLLPNTNLPFYTGWDESLRKLIITNRMLSRKDAGFTLSINQPSVLYENFLPVDPKEKRDSFAKESYSVNSASITDIGQQSRVNSVEAQREGPIEFSLAPLQGMNAATTLYWQIPFTTYDPDQFFALGMDGFSPISWRKFLFRHSILKTWLTSADVSDFAGITASRPALAPASFGEGKGTWPILPSEKEKARVKRPPGEDKYLSQDKESSTSLVVKSKTYNENSLFYLTNGAGYPFPYPLPEGNGVRSEAPLAPSSLVRFRTTLGSAKTPYAVTSELSTKKYKQQKNAFAVSRRLKKRYRRVKKHPRTPVWFPSGPLLNQVLPVHYIYVFYKRARLPRDRYIKRRLLNVKNLQKNPISFNLIKQSSQSDYCFSPFLEKTNNNFTCQNSFTNSFNYDFTLRKRLKPKRKYHLKRDYYSSNVIIPRRFKFMSISNYTPSVGNVATKQGLGTGRDGKEETALQVAQSTHFRKWRPFSSLKIHKPIADVVKEQLLLRKSTVLREQRSSKQPNIRVKQLRRRVQRQILRTVWRYRPRAGGFVWPGDYLKLELVKAPKLQLTSNSTKQNVDLVKELVIKDKQEKKEKTKKQKRKKKRTLVEWQIQPKKYLYNKHNLHIIKKKLLQSFPNPSEGPRREVQPSYHPSINSLRNSISPFF